MGKYSAPAVFAGQQQRSGDAAQRTWPKTDWGKVVDEKVDVVAAIYEHVGVDLGSTDPKKRSRRQVNGKCPYPGCDSKEDAFMVWPTRSPRTQNHYHCRRCKQSGDIIKLLQDINGWSFVETLGKLGLLDDEQVERSRQSSTRKPSARELEEAQREKFFQEQLAMLRHLYPLMQDALTAYERPQAYLAGRGISIEQAQKYGLGYIASPKETGKPPHKDLWMWQGRIVFPLTSPKKDELTFAGRTLALWEPEMTPAEHKAAIEAWNAQYPQDDRRRVIRVLKTSPCGYFGYKEAIAGGRAELVIPEGEFDALSLLIAGIEGVIAMGTGFAPSLIPVSVESVVLAMDADDPGKQAAYQLSQSLAGAGLYTRQIVPPTGKDWNDMLVVGDLDAITKLFPQEPPALAKIIPFPTTAMAARKEPIDTTTSEEDDDNFCSQCKAPVEHFEYDEASEHCIPYCGCCWMMKQLTLALPDSQIEQLDCPAQEYIAWRCKEIDAANERVKLAFIKQSPQCWYAKCKAPTTLDGWCEEHAAGREAMQLGEIYKFAALQVNEALQIGSGVEYWLGYARVARPERVLQIWRLVEKLLKKKGAPGALRK